MSARNHSNSYTSRNKVEIVRGGKDFFDRIEQIADNARYSLHLQTYIFDNDETGEKVAQALIRAAQRKVHVYVLVDGYASQHLSDEFISRLQVAGVHFSFFGQFFKSSYFYIGRRMHHKIIVADAAVCMVAGINISNRYNDTGTSKAWLDWAVHAEGEAASGIDKVCIKMWNRSVFRKKCSATDPPAAPLPMQECAVRIRRNDWLYKKTEITKSYRELFAHSQGHITLMTSYFWPPDKLRRGMAAAARRGVKIRLILTAKADVPFSKYTERYLYQWLFRNKIELYEYEANVLHGKLAVADNNFITAGSYNVNNISAFASVELNLDVKNTTIATEINNKLSDIIKNDCKQITEAGFMTRNNAARRFLYYLSYRFIHFVFFLFTFYFIQQRENRRR